jgi:hypothetical protein
LGRGCPAEVSKTIPDAITSSLLNTEIGPDHLASAANRHLSSALARLSNSRFSAQANHATNSRDRALLTSITDRLAPQRRILSLVRPPFPSLPLSAALSPCGMKSDASKIVVAARCRALVARCSYERRDMRRGLERGLRIEAHRYVLSWQNLPRPAPDGGARGNARTMGALCQAVAQPQGSDKWKIRAHR